MQSIVGQCFSITCHNRDVHNILRFSRTKTHASLQGNSNINTAAWHSVSINLRSRHWDWQTTSDCAVLPNITFTTPCTKLDTGSWKIPKGNVNRWTFRSTIDLLFGADLIYKILRSGKRTRPGNYPVLKERVLGWTFSGRTPAVSVPSDTQCTFLLREVSNLEHDLNRFWEV
jgi:hypothetical protein